MHNLKVLFRRLVSLLKNNLTFQTIIVICLFASIIFGYTYWASSVRPGVNFEKGWYGWADQNEYLVMASNILKLDFSPNNYFAYPLGYPLLGSLFLNVFPQDPFLIPNFILYTTCLIFVYLISLKIIKENNKAIIVTLLLFLVSSITDHLYVPWTTNLTTVFSFIVLYVYLCKFSIKRLALLSFLAGYTFFTRYSDGLILVPFVLIFLIRGINQKQFGRMKLIFAALFPGLLMFIITIIFNLIIYNDIKGSYYQSVNNQGFDPLNTWITKIIGMFLNPIIYQHDNSILSVAVVKQSLILLFFPISFLLLIRNYLKNKQYSTTFVLLSSFIIWCILYIPFVAISPETLKYGSARYIGVIFPIIFLSLIYFISYVSEINLKKIILLLIYMFSIMISFLLISLNKTTPLDLVNSRIYTITNSSISKNLIDNNIDSEWHSESPRKNGDNMVIEFQRTYEIRGFELDSSKSKERCLPNFNYSTSNDGFTWNKPKSFRFDTCTSNFIRYIYPESSKQIKFTLENIDENDSKVWSLNNIIIYK